jgi:hypothetical protein
LGKAERFRGRAARLSSAKAATAVRIRSEPQHPPQTGLRKTNKTLTFNELAFFVVVTLSKEIKLNKEKPSTIPSTVFKLFVTWCRPNQITANENDYRQGR